MKPRIGWGQPLASWDAPGWAPLVDPGPRSLLPGLLEGGTPCGPTNDLADRHG